MQSQYTGVVWHSKRKKWWARFQINKRQVDLGYFESEHEAAIELQTLKIEHEKQVLAGAEKASFAESNGKRQDRKKEEFRYARNSPTIADYATANSGRAEPV